MSAANKSGKRPLATRECVTYSRSLEAAVREMEAAGWVVHLSAGRSSHAWARAECPLGHLECTLSVYQTPAVAHHEARRLRSAIRRCERRSEAS